MWEKGHVFLLNYVYPSLELSSKSTIELCGPRHASTQVCTYIYLYLQITLFICSFVTFIFIFILFENPNWNITQTLSKPCQNSDVQYANSIFLVLLNIWSFSMHNLESLGSENCSCSTYIFYLSFIMFMIWCVFLISSIKWAPLSVTFMCMLFFSYSILSSFLHY